MRSIFQKAICLVCCFFAQKSIVFAQKGSILITRQPVDQTVCAGTPTAYFSVDARSGCAETLDYQWLVSADGGQDWQAAPSGKTASFAVPSSVLQIFGQLKIKARVSGAGCEMIESLAVNLIGEGAVQAAVFPKNLTVENEGRGQFEVKTESLPSGAAVGFQWQRSFYGTGVFEDILGETASILELKKAGPELNGSLFRARVTGAGICERTFSAPAALFVNDAPLISVVPREKSVCERGTATFGIQIKNGKGSETFQWQISRDEGKIYKDLPGEMARYFKAEDLSSEFSGALFRAVVTLPSGAKVPSGAARLTVNGTVAMSQQPADFLACVGDSAIFSIRARASGNNLPSYQWQESRDGGASFLNLSGQTRENLAIGSSDETLNGRLFRALVTAGECQEMASESARLDIVQSVRFEQKMEKMGVVGDVIELETRPSASPGTFLNQWQWSTDGANWTPIRESASPRLTITNLPATHDGRLFRYKVFSKECGRIQYSEPILLRVSSGR